MERWCVWLVHGAPQATGGVRIFGREMSGTWVLNLAQEQENQVSRYKFFTVSIASYEARSGLWKVFMTENKTNCQDAKAPRAPRRIRESKKGG